MTIDDRLIREVTGCLAPEGLVCDELGLVNADRPGTLSFVDEPRYLPELLANRNVTAAFATAELAARFQGAHVVPIVSEDPRWDYYTLYNVRARASVSRWPSEIDPSALVHPRAYVAEHNVRIGPGCVLEPNATILPDVEMGRECIIRAGAVVGSEGFEHKLTSRGVLSVFHDGRVIVGDFVEIGACTAVDKGLKTRDTVIGDFSKVDNLIHIAHAAHIGQRCRIAASALIAGSTTLGDEVWVGAGALVSNQLRVGDRAEISIGAVVTRDVPAGERVTGNFAIAHRRFIENLKAASR